MADAAQENQPKPGNNHGCGAIYNIGTDVFGETDTLANTHERRNLLEQKLGELGEGCRELISTSLRGKPMDEVAQTLNNTYADIREKKANAWVN
ncbi:MAG: hypothetical protein ABIX01_18990 [Chitinophagaceae bacterium]